MRSDWTLGSAIVAIYTSRLVRLAPALTCGPDWRARCAPAAGVTGRTVSSSALLSSALSPFGCIVFREHPLRPNDHEEESKGEE